MANYVPKAPKAKVTFSEKLEIIPSRALPLNPSVNATESLLAFSAMTGPNVDQAPQLAPSKSLIENSKFRKNE